MANILYDGKTAKSFEQITEEGWTFLRGGNEDKEGIKKLQKAVPWLYRGWRLRTNAVASVPFILYKGSEVWDESVDWQNKLGWLPNPKRLFRLVEGSLTLFGKSYLFNTINMLNTSIGLRYLYPGTIKPIVEEEAGLVGFERRLPSRAESEFFEVEQIVHFWMTDPYVEVGPPESSPATAAIAGAGVLWNVDEFASAFFERGAIKATILAVPQGTQREEKERLEKWYTSALRGLKNAWATKVLNADAVVATVIGEGVKELQNTELTKEKREDIATALGIPQSKLFSSSATDSNREQDEVSFIRDTIIPETELLEEVMNEQVFEGIGLRLAFQPNELDVMQEDEEQRSEAVLNYAIAGMKLSIATQILGVDLPEGVTPEQLDEGQKELKAPGVAAGQERVGLVEEEKSQFLRWSKKRDKSRWHEFEFNHLSELEQFTLKQMFDIAPKKEPEDAELVKALTGVIDELRNTKEPDTMIINVSTPDIKVEVPEREVTVNVPENIHDTIIVKNEVKAEVPDVVVNVPETVVNVEAPDVTVENVVNVPEQKKRKTKVKRDSRGQVTEMETE